MYVMLTGLFPFSDRCRKDLFHSIETEKVHLPIGFSKETASIIKAVLIRPCLQVVYKKLIEFILICLLFGRHQFLQKDPERRLGSVAREGAGSAVRHHPYFKHIDWSALESLQIEPIFVPKNVGLLSLLLSHCVFLKISNKILIYSF